MGKHKSKKRSKEKTKHRSKRSKSSSSSSDSEDEWVEKVVDLATNKKEERYKDDHKKDRDSAPRSTQRSEEHVREEWMNLSSSSSFLTESHLDRRKSKEEQKKLEREKQLYNPRECDRELNPYWKDGGSGLPTFQKPHDTNEYYENTRESSSSRSESRSRNWKKPKIDETFHKPHTSDEYYGSTYSRTKSSRSSNWKKTDREERKTNNDTVDEKHNQENTKKAERDVIAQDEELSEKELNMLGAKIIKAEIMGNHKLVQELKQQMEKARSLKTGSRKEEEGVLLTHMDSQGRAKPVVSNTSTENIKTHKRKKNIDTHRDGQRVKYFADDDKYTLKQMFENEKYSNAEDSNREFINMTKKVSKNDDLDDIFSDNIRKEESHLKTEKRNKDKAISQQQLIEKSLDNCNKCIQSEIMPKHLMVSMSETIYLGLPPHEPLTEGHCLIIPIRHTSCSTQLDENEWTDILTMRKALVKMFHSKGNDVIFFEYAMGLHKFPHMYIECVPLPKEEGDMAPIYFKKAIDECEMEWSQNKKLVSLKGRDVRKAIPKGLSYFFVSFGMEEGYAHVIEDEQLFPKKFAQEIIGGMLDVHHNVWRNPKTQSFEEQSKRVLQFSRIWKDFDNTVSV